MHEGKAASEDIHPVLVDTESNGASGDVKPNHLQLVERTIIVPPSLEVVTDNSNGIVTFYIDRLNQRVYRVIDQSRWKEVNDDEKQAVLADFNRTIEVARIDKTGLTPKVYAYDPEALTIELEYIEGKDLTQVRTVPIEVAREFFLHLTKFLQQGLYHGNLFSLKNYILEDTSNTIRLINTACIFDTTTLPAINRAQQVDLQLALKRFWDVFKISISQLRGRLVENVEHRFGTFQTKITPELEQAIFDHKINYVFQRGIGFADGNDESKRFLETSDFGGGENPMFGSCIVLALWSPDSRKGALVHFDHQTDLDLAKQMLLRQFNNQFVEVSLVGGQTNVSELLLQEINTVFGDIPGWKAIRVDTLGPKYAETRQVVLDAKSGAVFNLKGANQQNMKSWTGVTGLPREILERSYKAATTEKGLIVDVS